MTSVGFRQLTAHQYVEAIQKLQPDIAIGLADIVTAQAPGNRRRGKMVDRTHAFTRDALEQLYGSSVAEDKKSKAAYFAPVLPLENAQQSLYLEDLETEFRERLSGLALYESTSLSFIPDNIGHLPRLLLSEPVTPHEILRDISLGADLMTIPLIGACSDAGIALDFVFPAPSSTQERGEPQFLGIDLWSSEFAKDISPFKKACECYACRHHHRAYLNHLLAAKEMTAWVLLQLHNHHIMDRFFAGVRDSIQRGTFEEDVYAFNRAYSSELPSQSGEGPRYDFFSRLRNYIQLTNAYLDCVVTTSLPDREPTIPSVCKRCMVALTTCRRSSTSPSLRLRHQTRTRQVWRDMGLPQKYESHTYLSRSFGS
jgi:queuine tRNA-ribosyltransferase subunit QTRTD1